MFRLPLVIPQRAFRGAKARQACSTALKRAKIFGGAAYLREGLHLRMGDAVTRTVMREAPSATQRGRKERGNDKEFRDVLKSSVLEGYEDLYLHYAVVEQEMSLIGIRHQAAAITNDDPSSEAAMMDAPLLGAASSSGVVRGAVDCFRSELERVDAEFEAAVEEVAAILEMIKREAAPKKVLRNPGTGSSSLSTDPRGPDALQKMQIGLNRGLKAALKDLYKKMFILIQVPMPPLLFIIDSGFLMAAAPNQVCVCVCV